MIDLHLHTTTSDGRSSPEELVEAARRNRVRTLAVTDHDTVGGLDRTAVACARHGITWVPGVEITAMRDGVDVHVLGYFLDHRAPSLLTFLESQTADRRRRVREMAARLAAGGLRIDADEVLASHHASGGQWVGRPMLAMAMVRAGFVRSVREAFDVYLADGGAAWVPRRAPAPEDVVSIIHRAGGLASLAHPGLIGHDEWIPGLVAAGLDALEAYYADHSIDTTRHYLNLAEDLHLEVTGGSDYHGAAAHGPARPGSTRLPDAAFHRLERRWNAEHRR